MPSVLAEGWAGSKNHAACPHMKAFSAERLLPGRPIAEGNWEPPLALPAPRHLSQGWGFGATMDPCLVASWTTCKEGQGVWPNALPPAACNVSSNLHGQHTAYTWGKRPGRRAGCHCSRLSNSPKAGCGKLQFCFLPEKFLKHFMKACFVVLHFSKENCFCTSLKANCRNIPGAWSGTETCRRQKQRTFNPDQAEQTFGYKSWRIFKTIIMYSACCSASPLTVGLQKGHMSHEWRKKGKHSARWILLRALIFPYFRHSRVTSN